MKSEIVPMRSCGRRLMLTLMMSVCTGLKLTLPIARRRIIVVAIPALVWSAPPARAELTRAPPPTNFLLLPEGRPYVNYLENAGQLASHLKWFSSQGVDSVVGAAPLNDEITQFTAIYAPRPGTLIEAGTTPGLAELMTACDALAPHFSRYDGGILPLPDALAASVRRNAFVAQKLIKRARDSRGKWPTCGPEGRALGSRSTACSTMSVM